MKAKDLIARLASLDGDVEVVTRMPFDPNAYEPAGVVDVMRTYKDKHLHRYGVAKELPNPDLDMTTTVILLGGMLP